MKVPGLSFDFERFDASGAAWRETSEAGVRWLPLHLEGERGGRRGGEPADATVLIRMEPGHGYPAHRHVGIEEVLVLEGGYRDERGTWTQGDYVRYPAGSVHAPVALGDPERPAGPDNPPCLLFATARGGVELVEGD